VSNGRTSTSVVYGRLQVASCRARGIEWSLSRIGGQGTRPARLGFTALGGTAWGGPAGADGGPTTQATLPSADHAAEIARLQRENERLRMERDILKNCPAPGAPVRGRNSLVLSSAAGRVAAVRLLEAQSPLKNMVHGCMRT
jgi:hypothetical protein